MCETQDVIASTRSSAATISHALRYYGGGSMGEGVRKLGHEMLQLGVNEGYQKGFAIGRNQGLVQGIVFTLISIGGLSCAAWKTYEWRKRRKGTAIVVSSPNASIPVSIEQAIAKLPEKERVVIAKLYGLNGCQKQEVEEVAEEFKESIESIRERETSALRRLRTLNAVA